LKDKAVAAGCPFFKKETGCPSFFKSGACPLKEKVTNLKVHLHGRRLLRKPLQDGAKTIGLTTCGVMDVSATLIITILRIWSHYPECSYVDCYTLLLKLNVVMLSVVMLNVVAWGLVMGQK
jgi:hypothetical protein